jgi:CRISPR-associated protein Csm3
MFAKIGIEMDLVVQTGLHIGATDVFSAIGAIDSPVVRDPFTGYPMIPGSSLKGKMRALLAKATSNNYVGIRHEGEPMALKRLFGSSEYNVGKQKVKAARLQFADAFLTNASALLARGSITEAKAENGIDRITAVANPRQIERVVRGARFGVKLTYDLEEQLEAQEDFQNIALGMRLLSMDYLGGHGSRGSGRVCFEDVQVGLLYASEDFDIAPLRAALKEAEGHAV